MDTTGSCVPRDRFGFDPHNSSRLLRCTDSLCKDCTTDYSSCSRCVDSTLQLHSLCSPLPLHGVDLGSFTVAPCASSKCLNCTNNYQICTECDTSRGYILSNGACNFQLKKILLASKSTDVKRRVFEVVFDSSIASDTDLQCNT